MTSAETTPERPTAIETLFVEELRQIHADALNLSGALDFIDLHSDSLDGDDEQARDSRNGIMAVLSILRKSSKALTDRIEELQCELRSSALAER